MASGDTLLIFTPLHNEPPSSNNGRLDSRNARPVLDFDSAINESSHFSCIMPRNYSGSGLTVYIHYAMSSAIIGTVKWNAAFERIGNNLQNLDSDGFAPDKSTGGVSVPGVSGLVDIVNIVFANGVEMDSIEVGESFRLRITRDASGDTASGDAELVAIEIKET